MADKTLLVVAHAPSPNTARLRDALLAGARSPDVSGINAVARAAFDATPEDVRAAQAVVLFTPENLAYMSGALKDFFDRCYYPCLAHTQGMPYTLCVRAGQGGGEGTCRAIDAIATGLRWRAVAAPLICRGDWRDSFVDDCRERGALVAAGLEAGIF